MLVLALILPLAKGRAAPAPKAPVEDSASAPQGAKDAVRDRARAHFAEGKKRFALRQFHAALESFTRAYELLPLPGFLFNIGQCHRFLGDCKKAIFFYSGFVRENPDTPDAAVVSQLIAKCRRDLEKDEDRRTRAASLFAEARKAVVLQQYTQALALLTEAYRVFPLPGYLFHLGEVHRAQERHDKAIHFYEAYLQENPGTPETSRVRELITRCRQLQQEKDRQAAASLVGRPGGGPDPGGPTPTPAVPLHRKWWFWTSLAAGVAAAVGLGLGLGMREDKQDAGSLGTWKVVLP